MATAGCLNCGAELSGPFCAACGQRVVPPDPTVAELAGDAWQELTGYDGRIAATVRGLLHPGRLTIEYLTGHRARYLPPVRVYLIVSVAYFIIAAAVPPTPQRRAVGGLPVGITIGLWSSSNVTLTAEQRQEVLAEIEDAPSMLRPMFRSMVEDSDAFRQRLLTTMPRVFFGLLPVFALIVSLFYRGRRFPTHMVFAVHVHAFAFVGLSLAEAVKFSQMDILQAAVGLVVFLSVLVYALRAFKAVYGGGWLGTIARAAGVGVLYVVASIPALFLILAWAAVT
jgi:hypothetical protein